MPETSSAAARIIERLVGRLGTIGSAGRFVAVVGPSGSGKSSVVKAGLLPAIRKGALPGSAEWFVVQMVPSEQPFDELTAALRTIAINPRTDLLARLTAGADGLVQSLRAVLPDDRSQLLLVVDQFEELFTLTDPSVCHAFLNALTSAVLERHSRLRLVITLRGDFYDRPLDHHAFGELLRWGTELITAMSPDELQRAIEGPADGVGVGFDPGLVAAIVAEVADRAGALPLLQYALHRAVRRAPRRPHPRGGPIRTSAGRPVRWPDAPRPSTSGSTRRPGRRRGRSCSDWSASATVMR